MLNAEVSWIANVFEKRNQSREQDKTMNQADVVTKLMPQVIKEFCV